MTDNRFQKIAEIEAGQAALRDSIERTKDLAEQAESLLQKHKEALATIASSIGAQAGSSAAR